MSPQTGTLNILGRNFPGRGIYISKTKTALEKPGRAIPTSHVSGTQSDVSCTVFNVFATVWSPRANLRQQRMWTLGRRQVTMLQNTPSGGASQSLSFAPRPPPRSPRVGPARHAPAVRGLPCRVRRLVAAGPCCCPFTGPDGPPSVHHVPLNRVFFAVTRSEQKILRGCACVLGGLRAGTKF